MGLILTNNAGGNGRVRLTNSLGTNGRVRVFIPPPNDPDAQAFIIAAGITNPTQQSAINTLVISMKANGTWAKCNAIYPMVGGTATTHKFNLKDPRDLDTAYRLSFVGGWTHSTNGALPNGTNAYADTRLATNTLTSNSNHLSVYVRTAQTANAVPIGSFNNVGILLFQLNISTLVGLAYYSGGVATELLSSLSNSLGFFMGTTRANNDRKTFRNAVEQDSLTTAINTSYNSLFNYLGARNDNNVANNYSGQQIAFSTIGGGLSDTQQALMYADIQAFQTTLGRQV
jgi:hypothetical protein